MHVPAWCGLCLPAQWGSHNKTWPIQPAWPASQPGKWARRCSGLVWSVARASARCGLVWPAVRSGPAQSVRSGVARRPGVARWPCLSCPTGGGPDNIWQPNGVNLAQSGISTGHTACRPLFRGHNNPVGNGQRLPRNGRRYSPILAGDNERRCGHQKNVVTIGL
jgi:hypothetical protein